MSARHVKVQLYQDARRQSWPDLRCPGSGQQSHAKSRKTTIKEAYFDSYAQLLPVEMGREMGMFGGNLSANPSSGCLPAPSKRPLRPRPRVWCTPGSDRFVLNGTFLDVILVFLGRTSSVSRLRSRRPRPTLLAVLKHGGTLGLCFNVAN